MGFKKLENKVSYYWFIKRLIFLLIVLIAYLIALNYIPNDYLLLLMVPGGLLLLILFIYTFFFPFIQIKVYKYFIDDEKIVVNYGVLFRHYTIIPILQIQDIGSFQGPIQIGLKISNIIITTAGSAETIKCINNKLAKEIVEDIQNKINKRLQKEEPNALS